MLPDPYYRQAASGKTTRRSDGCTDSTRYRGSSSVPIGSLTRLSPTVVRARLHPTRRDEMPAGARVRSCSRRGSRVVVGGRRSGAFRRRSSRIASSPGRRYGCCRDPDRWLVPTLTLPGRIHECWTFRRARGATGSDVQPPPRAASKTAVTSAANPSSSDDAADSPVEYTPCSTYASPSRTSTVIVSSRGSTIQYSGMPASA